MKTAIVTGANGFVGKAVSQELAEQGVHVYAVVRQNAGHLDRLSDNINITIVQCNMDSYDKLPMLIDGRDIDCFYHFAWEGSSGPLRADETVQLRNVSNSCKAVRVAKEIGCAKFIFASSIMEFEVAALMGTTRKPAVTTIYCTAKITANYMCRALATETGIAYLSGVISNIYGPGEYSPRLINTTIRKLLRGEHTSFSPGEQLYDFIYVRDAAKMFAAIGDNGISNKMYYIGNRQPRKLKDFLLEMRDVVAPEAELGLGDFLFNGISLSYQEFDTNSVYADTGFEPQFSFREGIRNTAEWLRLEEHLNG